MRFYHRTSLPPDDVLAVADQYFATKGTVTNSGPRSRSVSGPTGTISLEVRPEGGHYTRLTIETDKRFQGENEKIAKGFFTSVHVKAHPGHVARGSH